MANPEKVIDDELVIKANEVNNSEESVKSDVGNAVKNAVGYSVSASVVVSALVGIYIFSRPELEPIKDNIITVGIPIMNGLLVLFKKLMDRI